jgi:hypothetical protein
MTGRTAPKCDKTLVSLSLIEQLSLSRPVASLLNKVGAGAFLYPVPLPHLNLSQRVAMVQKIVGHALLGELRERESDDLAPIQATCIRNRIDLFGHIERDT